MESNNKVAQGPNTDVANLRKFKIFVEDMNPNQNRAPGQGPILSGNIPPSQGQPP